MTGGLFQEGAFAGGVGKGSGVEKEKKVEMGGRWKGFGVLELRVLGKKKVEMLLLERIWGLRVLGGRWRRRRREGWNWMVAEINLFWGGRR